MVLLYEIRVSVNWRIVINEGSCFFLSAGKSVSILTSCGMEIILYEQYLLSFGGKQDCEVVPIMAQNDNLGLLIGFTARRISSESMQAIRSVVRLYINP